MSLKSGDNVRLVATPAQTGTVTRDNPLGVQQAVVVTWASGPLFAQGIKVAYFGSNYNELELDI